MSVKHKNTKSAKKAKSSKKAFKFTKSMLISGAALVITLIFGALFYIFVVSTHPVRVTNALAYLNDATIAKIMHTSVSETLADKSFTIIVDGKESVFRLGDYEFTYSSNTDGHSEVVNYLDSNGKNQTKLITTKGNLSFNETAVHAFINNLAKEYGTPMIEPYYEIDGDVMTIYKGTDGMGIDFNELMTTITERIRTNNYSSITTQVKTLKASDVNIDTIYQSVKCDPVDASVTEDSAGNPTFTEEIVGKDFDLEAARHIVSRDADSWKITLALTYPEVTLKQVRAPYCLDLLSSVTTGYAGSSKERANNVEKAAYNINHYGNFTDGYILQPGEEFSYNKTVGKRTEANGFMKAPVYVASGSMDDYGGGICQVSTALYYVALQANLQITERHNHFYTVGYWKVAGVDATVDWGRLDFKFKNNKEYPIKITCTYAKRQLTVSIMGTSDGITSKLEREILETTPFQTVYKKPTSQHREGEITLGTAGKKIRVFQTIYQDGKFVSKKQISEDTYLPFNKVIYTNNLPEGAEYS
ncbi:MAG: VanW family protein [Acutalibacteraceae bacterium]|nr:VanW family protein [Bacillota bacterium]